jgi:hypothetical protein
MAKWWRSNPNASSRSSTGANDRHSSMPTGHRHNGGLSCFPPLNHRPAILRPASVLALPCLVPPAICLQATSQRPAMAFPFPFPSRPCLRPASLWPPVASGLPRPPASQPRPARGDPRPSWWSMRARPCPEASQDARTPASQQAIRPASQRALGDPASQHRRRPPGDRQEATRRPTRRPPGDRGQRAPGDPAASTSQQATAPEDETETCS